MAALGTSLPVFLGLTVVLFGWGAWRTGVGLAATWRPAWHLLPYTLLLAAANRFFDWSLFNGALLSLAAYGAAVSVLLALGLISYRLTQVHKMTTQYPWLYRVAGPFAWRKR